MPIYPDTTDRWMDGVDQQLREINTRLGSIPSDATAAPWLVPASFGSGWTDLSATDSGFDACGFQVLPTRRVAIRGGAMRSGSAWPASGFTLLTLPTGLYPVKKQSFLVLAPYGNGWAAGEIRPAGTILIFAWGGGTTGAAGTAVGLDGVTYRLA